MGTRLLEWRGHGQPKGATKSSMHLSKNVFRADSIPDLCILLSRRGGMVVLCMKWSSDNVS
jgi:hypothetical protein